MNRKNNSHSEIEISGEELVFLIKCKLDDSGYESEISRTRKYIALTVFDIDETIYGRLVVPKNRNFSKEKYTRLIENTLETNSKIENAKLEKISNKTNIVRVFKIGVLSQIIREIVEIIFQEFD